VIRKAKIVQFAERDHDDSQDMLLGEERDHAEDEEKDMIKGDDDDEEEQEAREERSLKELLKDRDQVYGRESSNYDLESLKRNNYGTIDLKKIKTKILNKLNRKINLDKIMIDWKKSNPGIFNWLSLLNRIDDEKLQKLCGTDIALYIIWIRYSATFFSVVSLINLFVFWLYLTGKPSKEDDYK